MPIETAGLIGGLFALLAIAHFASDFIFQSHAEAMAKPTNTKVRAKHCLVYSGLLTVLIFAIFDSRPWWETGMYFTILFTSHFIEDTYLPVYLWAKYIRKAPEFEIPVDEPHAAQPTPDMARFLAFASTPLGKILLISIDQIIHLGFLLPIAAMIFYSGSPETVLNIFGVTMVLIVLLEILSRYGKRQLRAG